MNLASSDANEDDTVGALLGEPSRPNGTCVARAALFSAVPVKRVSMPVSRGARRDGIHANSRLGRFRARPTW